MTEQNSALQLAAVSNKMRFFLFSPLPRWTTAMTATVNILLTALCGKCWLNPFCSFSKTAVFAANWEQVNCWYWRWQQCCTRLCGRNKMLRWKHALDSSLYGWKHPACITRDGTERNVTYICHVQPPVKGPYFEHQNNLLVSHLNARHVTSLYLMRYETLGF